MQTKTANILNYKTILYLLLSALLVYCFVEIRALKSFKPLKNVDFSHSTNDRNNTPTQWVLGGAGTGTIQINSSMSRGEKAGIQITQTSGKFITLYQDAENIEPLGNRKYSFGCWVKTIHPNSVRLAIEKKGKGAAFSNYHSGSGKWEYLTVNSSIPAHTKSLRAHISLINNATADIEDAALSFALPYRVFFAIAFVILIILIILYLRVFLVRKHVRAIALSLASKFHFSNREIPYWRMQRIPLISVLFLIILFAFLIRIIGLNWGIPTPQIPHAFFQCDEGHSMMATCHVDFNPQHIDLNPANGHIEGSLSFYVYNFVAVGLKNAGFIQKMPHEFSGIDSDYSTFIYAARIVSVLSGLLSIVIIFYILRVITQNDLAALIGAFLFAIVPFEAIHAHYMRTHTISNLFIVLMIFISLQIYRDRTDHYKLYMLLGIIAGAATATRYPIGIIITIPVMMLMYKKIFLQNEKWSYSLSSFAKLCTIAVDRRIFIIVIFWLIGFFVTDPTFFLNFKEIQQYFAVIKENTATNEFSLQNLFDLSRIKDYLFYLVPFGAFPFLWLIFYFSFVSIFFLRKYYKYSLPLCLFLFLYLYPMAKGYSLPIFIRAVLPLFPVFSILSAIIITYFFYAFKNRRVFFYSWILFISLICISSAGYVLAYSIAMSKEDPRIQLYHYLNTHEKNRELIFGIPHSLTGYINRSIVEVLPDKSVTFIEGVDKAGFLDKTPLPDYILLYTNFWPGDNTTVKANDFMLTHSNRYVLDKIFENRLLVFGFDITYLNFFRDPPIDLQFPFPKLYLYKKNQM